MVSSTKYHHKIRWHALILDTISISENIKTNLETERINKNINDKVMNTAQKANWMLVYLNTRTKTHTKLKENTFKASKRKHSLQNILMPMKTSG